MSFVFVQGKRHVLSESDFIDSGGEADIYRFGADSVLKRYKEPTHPDYSMNPAERTGAVQRLRERQLKLPDFPKNLPERVIGPHQLVHAKAPDGPIVGYTMPFLRGMEVLLQFSNRKYREQGGIDGNRILSIFRDLHGVIESVHQSGIVIGDFNDLNVLVGQGNKAFLIDADSMQFGRYLCAAFTTRFVDPLLCKPTKLELARPHNERSDWYAYLIMLCQSLLYVGPYGGVYRKAGKSLQHDDRVLKRLTFFDPDVRYPAKVALPINTLPDSLLDYMHKVFEHDLREVFPLNQLDSVRWTRCITCGTLHARSVCPSCQAPGAVKETVVIRGAVTATRVFRTSGRIIHATYQAGKLRYLYHEGGSFRRENDVRVIDGELDPELRYRIQSDVTLLGKRDKLFVFAPGETPQRRSTDTYRDLSVYDANDTHHYWIQSGQLVRDDRFGGSTIIGSVLAGQTLFWSGKKFGFGFYRAGQLMRSFVFDGERNWLNDQVDIPNLPGQLIDATCVFSDKRAWFMASLQEAGQLINRCYVVSADGSVVATTEAVHGDNSWLAAGIRGHLAVGSALYAATDEGIIRVGTDGSSVVVERSFPDTEPFVSSGSQLVPSPDGIYTVSNQEITLLKIQ